MSNKKSHNVFDNLHTGGYQRKYLLKRNTAPVDPKTLYTFEASRATLPTSVDMRKNCPAVYDQGNLGSCTANAIAGAYQFDQMKQKNKTVFVPSRMFLYYNERAMENSVSTDSGAMISDGIQSIANTGICPESQWPYVISKFATKPTTACYTSAKSYKCSSYKQISNSLQQLKQGLANGYPIVFGMDVYESFESTTVDKTGVVPMPKKNEQLLGGHAMLIVGYDDSKQWFIVRNSWGPSWGSNGYCFIPYAYLTDPNMASDFWSLITVSNN